MARVEEQLDNVDVVVLDGRVEARLVEESGSVLGVEQVLDELVVAVAAGVDERVVVVHVERVDGRARLDEQLGDLVGADLAGQVHGRLLPHVLVVERGAVLDEQEGRVVLVVRDGAEQRRVLLVVHVAERIVDGRAQVGPLLEHELDNVQAALVARNLEERLAVEVATRHQIAERDAALNDQIEDQVERLDRVTRRRQVQYRVAVDVRRVQHALEQLQLVKRARNRRRRCVRLFFAATIGRQQSHIVLAVLLLLLLLLLCFLAN